MKESNKIDRTPVTINQDGGQKTRRGRPLGSKNNLRNNSTPRPSSPAILTQNQFQTLQVEYENDDAWVCENCKTLFTNPDTKTLECQRCKKHYCTKCLNKSDDEYNILSKSDSMWFCGPCKGKVEKNIITDLKIEERCNAIIEEFEQRLHFLETEIQTKCDEDTVRKIVRQELVNNNQVDTNAAPILPQAANNSVTSVISELNERKSRKNNLIIYGTKECNSENVEERKDFDLELLTDIAQNCEVDLNTYNIGKLRRIGKFDKDKAHRPLLIQSETPDFKIAVLRNASKLKGTDKKYNTISLSHDMTKSEREEEKKLFAEAKEKEKKSQGKFTFKVRGPPGARRIIRVQ